MSYVAAMQGTGTSRVYLGSDGNVDVFSGGTRAARNFNPGNLRYGTFAQSEGAIGRDKDGFAIFPDKETGTAAQESLLSQPRYQNLSIDQAIAKYAPPQENDTAGYQSAIRQALGLPGSTPMSSLSADQLDRMVGAMQQHEGYTDASMRNIMNIGDPLKNYRSEFDPNDPAPEDSDDNGVGTGQRGEISSSVPASFTSLDVSNRSFKIGDNEIDLNGQDFSINTNGENVDLDGNTRANVSGSGDAIHLQANGGDYVGVFGQNQTVTGDSGSSNVNLGGDGTSATVSGGGYVGLCGNGENLTLTDQGSSVQTVGNAENEVVNANGSTISLAAGSLVNINGSSDTINLQGNTSETIGISGQGLTVSGDAGNDVVNLNANTSATVSGGGDVGLCGNGVTLTAEANQAFTINTAPGVTNDTVYADNSTLNLTPGWSGSIYGQGLTINMSPDSGSDVTIYGYDDQVTGNQGDTIQANAYDPNDTSDPYAPYQAGDPTPGTPYDPGDTTPSDPGDPGDPYDPGEFEGEKIVATKTTAATPAPASSSTGGSAPSSGSTQPPVSTTTLAVGHGTTTSASSAHIASQASQLASAMAAFGGASGSDTSLHTAPAAAQTTLTVDPSQPGHAAKPLRHAA